MAHSKYELFDRLRWNKRSLSFEMMQRVVYRKNKKEKPIIMDVVKRTIDQKHPQVRNMCKYTMSPWLFIAPTDFWWSTKEYGIDKWWDANGNCSIYGKVYSLEKLRKNIETHEKDFIYTFNALSESTQKENLMLVFNIYKMWKQHKKETEMLVKMGYIYLATQKSVYKMSATKKKQLIALLKKGELEKYVGIKDARMALKGIKNRYLYEQCHSDMGLYEYMLKKVDDIHPSYVLIQQYRDYIRMLNELGTHNLEDDYWKYPKDLAERHDQILQEFNEYKKIKEEKETQRLDNELQKMVSKQLPSEINGYYVYIANKMEDIRKQAEFLHQCLITCKYYYKVIEGDSLLVFVKKDDKPVATCQIDYKKKIKQFYADERDRNNCLPTSEIKEVMKTYLDGISNYKIKHLRTA